MDDHETITGLPHIARAIDGTHIRLQRKLAKEFYPAQYISRHGFPSILLQGIVDSRKLFWSVVCKAIKGVHDSTHFKESRLYAQLDVLAIELQGEIIWPYLLADSAYKAQTFLVKSFRIKTGPFAREKREFDKKLSKGRVKVENAFGFLKNRWRILQDVNADFALAPTIVGACCMLHNFVQLRGEAEPLDQQDPHPNHDNPIAFRDGGNPRHIEMALLVRSALFHYSALQDITVRANANPGMVPGV
ncbi:hypothetical protein L7F22_054727 [Adiantum nelumboides]|nr:hypothetical protein [Adiantum nelumboides]